MGILRLRTESKAALGWANEAKRHGDRWLLGGIGIGYTEIYIINININIY